MSSMHPAGRHLYALMQQADVRDTQPVNVRDELMDTQQIWLLDGKPLLPPPPGGPAKPRRFGRLMTWVDHSKSATVAVYGSAALAVVVEVALLAAWR